MTTTRNAREAAVANLDVASFFEFDSLDRFKYRVIMLLRYRNEEYLARRLLDRMKSLSPLDGQSRSGLLGMLDAWDIGGNISPAMFTMLQMKVQDMLGGTEN